MKIVLLSGSMVGTKTQIAMNTLKQKLITQAPEDEITFLNLKELSVEFSDGRNYLDYSGDTGTVTRALMTADLILIGSPTFQASIPGTLKNVFDLLPQSAFDKKIVGFVITAGSPKHFLMAETQLKPIIHYMKGQLVPSYVFIEEKEFYQQEIMSDDVLFRMDKLIEDALILTKAYQQVWQEQEDAYDF